MHHFRFNHDRKRANYLEAVKANSYFLKFKISKF